MRSLLIASLLTASGCLYAQTQAPANPAPPAPKTYRGGGAGEVYEVADPAALERGHKTYEANCSFCHGASAKGGESGPSLVRSVVVLHDEHGNQIGQVIRNGRPDKGMPKFPLSDDQISDVATYLHDQVRAAALRGTYQIQNIVTGDAKQGEAYFNAHCTSCHSVTADLAHIGKMEPVDLQQKIVMPREGRRGPGPAAPVPKTQAVRAIVTLASGQPIKGTLDHVDDFSIALTDDQGEYYSFDRDGDKPKVALQDPLQGHIDLLSKYSDADIHNLTAYLVTLK